MSSASFGKREREKKQRERAAAKRQRRLERHDQPDENEPPDADAEMERFRLLSEAYAAGAVDRDAYEAERREIFSALGVTDAFDDGNGT